MCNNPWDDGLPNDLLALVVKAAGSMNLLKGLRGVNKTWQRDFDLNVSLIKVHMGDPCLGEKGEFSPAPRRASHRLANSILASALSRLRA